MLYEMKFVQILSMFKNTDHISQKTHRVLLTRANGEMLYKLKRCTK